MSSVQKKQTFDIKQIMASTILFGCFIIAIFLIAISFILSVAFFYNGQLMEAGLSYAVMMFLLCTICRFFDWLETVVFRPKNKYGLSFNEEEGKYTLTNNGSPATWQVLSVPALPEEGFPHYTLRYDDDYKYKWRSTPSYSAFGCEKNCYGSYGDKFTDFIYDAEYITAVIRQQDITFSDKELADKMLFLMQHEKELKRLIKTEELYPAYVTNAKSICLCFMTDTALRTMCGFIPITSPAVKEFCERTKERERIREKLDNPIVVGETSIDI